MLIRASQKLEISHRELAAVVRYVVRFEPTLTESAKTLRRLFGLGLREALCLAAACNSDPLILAIERIGEDVNRCQEAENVTAAVKRAEQPKRACQKIASETLNVDTRGRASRRFNLTCYRRSNPFDACTATRRE